MSDYALILSTPNQNASTHPDLCMIDGKAYCTSLQVAEHFDKQHFHVIRDIEDVIAQVIETSEKSKNGCTANLFKKSEYSYANNLGAQVKKPMYYLSEQGFTLLAMGYTGAKAMQFKLAYMAAFEKMRDALNTILNAPYVEPETITQKQYQELRYIIHRTCSRSLHKGSMELLLWNKLRMELNVESVHKILASQFEHAKAILQNLHKNYYRQTLPFLMEVENHLIREHLCDGVPLTAEIRKQWKLKKGTLLPKPVNWKLLARQVIGDDE